MTVSRKQQKFINEYLICWNATEAARRADYAHPNKQGPRLLVNVGVAKEIERRLKENTMESAEVLSRLSDMARGNLADFASVESARDLVGHPRGHVVKKLKITRRKQRGDVEIVQMEIELNDPQSALEKIGKHYGLFADKIEHTWHTELPEGYEPTEVQRQFAEMIAQAALQAKANDESSSD